MKTEGQVLSELSTMKVMSMSKSVVESLRPLTPRGGTYSHIVSGAQKSEMVTNQKITFKHIPCCKCTVSTVGLKKLEEKSDLPRQIWQVIIFFSTLIYSTLSGEGRTIT